MHLALLLSCSDRPGIVARVSSWILEAGGNIIEADQHTDVEAGLFLQRIEFEADLGIDDVRRSFSPIAEEFAMTWSVRRLGTTAGLVVLASREAHCVYDLLSRIATGELDASCLALVSNHDELRLPAERFDIPFVHLPVDENDAVGQEHDLLALLDDQRPDLVVLARYMRILSPAYVAQWGDRTINIHHSFLPAFAGARPYQQAYERGVKVIGATAHYVTEELDDGPIIAQGVTPVSHRDQADDLRRHGRDIETVVLARAVRLHLEHRVIAYGNRTVVFD